MVSIQSVLATNLYILLGGIFPVFLLSPDLFFPSVFSVLARNDQCGHPFLPARHIIRNRLIRTKKVLADMKRTAVRHYMLTHHFQYTGGYMDMLINDPLREAVYFLHLFGQLREKSSPTHLH